MVGGAKLEQGGSDDASRQSKQSAQLGCCLARGSWTHRNVYQESTACRSILPASASPRDNNSNRQGITMAVVSCLLCYMAHSGAIVAYVRTWPVRTYAGKRAGSDI